MQKNLSFDIQDSVATLSINRPERRNALTVEMWEAIAAGVVQAQENPGVKAIVLRSAVEGVFSAGADLGDMKRAMTDEAFATRNLAAIKGASNVMAACPIPTLAVVNGMCFGGATALIASTDIRLAGPKASFATTPAKLGLAYPISDTKRLVGLMGAARTKRMIFTGDQISPTQAFAYGLVDEVFEDFDGETAGFINRLISRSLFTQVRTKSQLDQICGQVELQDDQLFMDAQTGQDATEGMAAFAAKNSPEFSWHPKKPG